MSVGSKMALIIYDNRKFAKGTFYCLPPEFMKTGVPEYIGREVAPMTAFEIISIFIGILGVRKDIL